jgi:flagellar basal body-associated protein FliL
MKFGVLVLMVVFLAVLVGLFYFSFKMLNKVRQEERAENAAKRPERQLHPKLQAELEKRKQQEQAEQDQDK